MRLSIRRLLRSSTSRTALRAADAYAVAGIAPALAFDFVDEYYRTSGSQTTFGSAITHSRDSLATMTDSDGLLKWAPHNRLLYSNDFTNAYWTKTSGFTVDSTTELDPDGGSTASLVSSVADFNSLRRNLGGPAGKHAVSLFIKKTSAASYFPGLSLQNASGYKSITIDTDNGSAVARDIEPVSSEDFGVSDAGTFWIVFLKNDAPTTVYFYPRVNTDAGSTWTGGAGSQTISYFHFYRSDLGGMVNNPDRGDSYVPTTTAARYIARRGHHVFNSVEWVNEGLLHESEARTNLVTYSSDFTDAGWVASHSTISGAPTQVGPDGNTSAYEWTSDAVTSLMLLDRAYTLTSGQDYTHSFFVKENGVSFVQIVIGGAYSNNEYANFDISNKVVGTSSLGATPRIEVFGDGWCRCSCTFTADADATGDSGLVLTNSASANRAADYTGDGTSGVYIWGAQLEAAPTPSSYIPTAGSTVTRSADTLTVDAVDLPWPEPVVIGDNLVTNGDFATGDLSGWENDGGDFVYDSGFVRDVGTSGTVFKQQLTTVAGKAYLIEFDFIADATDGTPSLDWEATRVFYLSNWGSVGGRASVILVATQDNGFFGFNGRNAVDWAVDNISVREIDPLALSIQMDGRMTYADTGDSTEAIFIEWITPSTHRIRHFLDTRTTRTGVVGFQQFDGANNDVVFEAIPGSYSPGILAPYNIASRHGSTFVNGAVDGVAMTANDTPTSLPDLSNTSLNLAYDYNGTIKLFRMWNRDLGDAGIATASLTAPAIFGVPSIAGDAADPEVGEILTAASAPVVLGAPSPTTAWQWLRDGAAISGETTSTYTLVEADIGARISVKQTATNAGGSANATSIQTAIVQPIGATIVTNRAGAGILDRNNSYIEVRNV